MSDLSASTRPPVDLGAALALARRLQQLSQELAEARTPQQVLDAVINSGIRAAGARAGLIALVDPEGKALEIVASRGHRATTMQEWHRFPLTEDLPLSRAVLRAEPIFIHSQAERDELFPALVGRSEEGHALTCLPLVVEGRVLGGLSLSFAKDEAFDEERRRFKVALAHQVAQALQRTRLFEAEQALRKRMSFLADAGYLLSTSLDYRQTLGRLAQLTVPGLADWCSVFMLSDDGTQIERIALAHSDRALLDRVRRLDARYPPTLDAVHGAGRVLRTQEPEFVPEITGELLTSASAGDEELLHLLVSLRLRSAITVPLVARGRPLGALSLVRSEPGTPYTPDDLELALEVARRAAQAVDNALLFRETQRQADAARALAHVADAVVLLDEAGQVRHWNPAAARLTGLGSEEVVGQPAAEAIPGWADIAEHAPLPDERPRMIPLPTPSGERWLSVLGVEFPQGRVYTLRDQTAEHELERVRSEFVATASHELRTPLSAIYGAIRTIRRTDVKIPDEQRELFLQMIETEAERLRAIVSQLLVAGQLDAEALSVQLRPVPIRELVEAVLAPFRVAAPNQIAVRDSVNGRSVLADEDLLRQVLTNLVDNAVKYSPDGGEIQVRIGAGGQVVRITVADQGLGIPSAAQARVFEKFYRLDPALTRGIGGSGLGLYIANELTRRMGGRLSLSSTPGKGSAFVVQLPIA